MLLLAFAATTEGCEPLVSPLGTLTSSNAGAAGELGQWGGMGGRARAFAGASTGGNGGSLGSFTAPRALSNLSSVGALTTDPSVTANGLEMYVMSTRNGNKDIWVSRRSSVVDDWPAPAPVAELNSDANESNCRVAPDGLTMWLYTDRDRSLGTLWQSHREKVTDPWEPPRLIPGIGAPTASDVSASSDGTQLVAVFASLRLRETQGYDLFEARRAAPSDVFGASALIAEINGAVDDYDPYLSPDGLLLLFHSNRSGNDDIYWAKRPDLDSPFDVPVALREVNSDAADSAPSMANDRNAIWFASTRDGDEQIYEATVIRK